MSNRVKEVRNQKGLTQNQLAYLTGGKLTQSEICKVETEWLSRPSKRQKAEIAKALDTPESELFPKP